MIRYQRRAWAQGIAGLVHEVPLTVWEDVGGSNRRARDYLLAALDLAMIWFRYMRKSASPTLAERRAAVAEPAAVTASVATHQRLEVSH
jgi:hypothetical protein